MIFSDISSMMAFLKGNTERKTKGGKVKIKEKIVTNATKTRPEMLNITKRSREGGSLL